MDKRVKYQKKVWVELDLVGWRGDYSHQREDLSLPDLIRNHQNKTDVTTKVRLWEHPKQDCVTFKIRQFIDGTPGASVCL